MLTKRIEGHGGSSEDVPDMLSQSRQHVTVLARHFNRSRFREAPRSRDFWGQCLIAWPLKGLYFALSLGIITV